ncbi:MAG: C-terminal binding protein [Alphaproteobacteria bacterium]|jgi:D-3-phosphoglycerate dehydrogenase|nr:C-terminal binding protein [Alphaproteobacteria bacterium]MDP6816810.1 C-terminal binding protein [Alphaproteobacteria bacterium]
MATVLQTDFAWPDMDIERAVIEGAGHSLVGGPSEALPAERIEALVAEHDPEAIMTCWAEVSAAAIASPTRLAIVQRIGVGLDNIAVEAATARGAWVANVPDYCVEEVSDHAVAMIMGWLRGVVPFDREVKAGRWNPAAAQLRRAANLTAGILGYGRIGRASARKLAGIGLTVLANDIAPPADPGPAQLAEMDELLARSDIILVHLPLTPDTEHLVDAAFLARMRPGSLLVNVSRGPVVDCEALIEALEAGPLSAAALDVVEGEPDPPAALVARADVVATPHVAFSSDASLAELRRRSAEEVVRVLAGQPPENPCNAPHGKR